MKTCLLHGVPYEQCPQAEHELLVASKIAAKLEELDRCNLPRPTKLVLNPRILPGISLLLGLEIIRVPWLKDDEACLLVKC